MRGEEKKKKVVQDLGRNSFSRSNLFFFFFFFLDVVSFWKMLIVGWGDSFVAGAAAAAESVIGTTQWREEEEEDGGAKQKNLGARQTISIKSGNRPAAATTIALARPTDARRCCPVDGKCARVISHHYLKKRTRTQGPTNCLDTGPR